MKRNSIFIAFCLLSFQVIQNNHAPVVKILYPGEKSVYARGARVHYAISVKDEEDGDSHFDEINPKEVLLKIKYIANQTMLIRGLKTAKIADPPGLNWMRTSNCFNCHGFDAKLSGPSFEEINEKYGTNPEGQRIIGKRISEGSVNVWGSTPMPSHPELSGSAIEDIVKFIQELPKDKDTKYCVGSEGFFVFPAGTMKPKKDMFLLVASYLDHGTANNNQRIKGEDAVVIFRSR
jgi:cytochrome c